jgi:hypothetical protein
MNSLHRIALTTLAILATSTFLYLFYQSLSFIGYPLGKTLVNLLQRLSGEGNADDSYSNTSSFLGAMLGFFIFMVLFPMALESTEPPQRSSGCKSERLVSAALWVGWVAVKSWGETLVVVGVLDGVVKGLGWC